MREITFAQALAEALREEMLRDKTVFIMSGSSARSGGHHGEAGSLYREFGPDRVRDIPLSEAGMVGLAIGSARTGMRPVVDIGINWIFHALDQIVNHAAKYRYMSGGKEKVPLVIRATESAGATAGAQHSQTLDASFMHFPGLRIVAPSTPYDAKGLLKASIRDDNPVIFLLHTELFAAKGLVPESEYLNDLGQADVKREGKDVTVVSVASMVGEALSAAEELERQGISLEVIDLRSLCPLDRRAIIASVKKTGRLLIAERGCKTNGLGAEVAASVAEEALDYLDAPIKRVAALDTPVPSSRLLRDRVIPDKIRIMEAVKEILPG